MENKKYTLQDGEFMNMFNEPKNKKTKKSSYKNYRIDFDELNKILVMFAVVWIAISTIMILALEFAYDWLFSC